MSIYTIDRDILALVDPETGEISDWEAFEQLQMERDAKIENTACYYKNTMAEAAAIKAEVDALKKRCEVLENRGKRLKEYLAYALNGQKFESPKCAISWRKTTSVQLNDEAAVIDWAQRMNRDDILKYTAPAVNKAELAKLLKNDVEVPGAEIVVGQSMGVK